MTTDSDLTDFLIDSVGDVINNNYSNNINNSNDDVKKDSSDNNDNYNKQKLINQNNRNQLIDNDLKNLISTQKLKKFTTLKLSVLKNHILSTELGLNSELNFVILFISDVIDTLVTIVKNKNQNNENRAIFVDLIVYLRSSLLFLLYHKLFAGIIYLYYNEKKCSTDINNDNKNINEHNNDIHSIKIEINSVIKSNIKCNMMDLIEEFRNQCKTIIQQNEIFEETEEMIVWSTYLVIEIYLASIISKYHLKNPPTHNNVANNESNIDNNNDNSNNITHDNLSVIKDNNIQNENTIDFQISKNLVHKLFSFLGNKFEIDNSVENEFSFLVNYDGSLSLFSVTIFQICLIIPFDIMKNYNSKNGFDNNYSNNNNENNNFKNDNKNNSNKTKKQKAVRCFSILELESAVRVILCLAGAEEENKNMPKKSKYNNDTKKSQLSYFLRLFL